MTHFFTSDLHLGHVRCVQWRPFEDVDEMNATIIGRWNDTVTPSDTVWILGIFAMGTIADTLPLAERLNGQKFLVPGNHDRCSSAYYRDEKPEKVTRKVTEWTQRYDDVDLIVVDPQPIVLHGVTFNISHFPYRGDHTEEERFTEFRPIDDGRWLLHGHTHGMWRVHDRMIDVGVDIWDFRPVRSEVLATLATQIQEA